MPVVDVVRAPADLLACQALRFQVYCRERAFLPSADYPDEIETDSWDAVATHLVAVSDGKLVGTARLIHHSHFGFPLERYCSVSIPAEIVPHTVEVSRLAVVPYSQNLSPSDRWGVDGGLARKVALQLLQKVYATAKQYGRTHLVAAMAPALVRVLKSYDIPLTMIGAAVDFGGWVRPFLISLVDFDRIETAGAIRFRAAAEKEAGHIPGFPSNSLDTRSIEGRA